MKHVIPPIWKTFGTAATVLAAFASTAAADIIITTANSYTFTPAPDNLISNMLPSTVINDREKAENTATAEVLTDAHVSSVIVESYTVGDNASITYTLSKAGEIYDITGVNLYTGWGGVYRNDITITSLAYSTPETPDSFVEIPDTGLHFASSLIAMAQYSATDGVLAGRVHSFRINFGTQESGYVGYREIEITGAARPVWNDGATDVAVYNAVLNGTVLATLDPGAQVSVAWGTDEDPAAWDANDRYDWASAPGAGALSHTVSGLDASTEYFFRFSVTTPSDTDYSRIEGFATLSTAPGITTGAASGVTDTLATISGTLVHAGVPPTTVYTFWGTDAEDLAASQSVGVVANGATFWDSLSGLTPNTVYYYSVMASNNFGMAWGATNSFRTTGMPALTDVMVDRVMDTTLHVTATLSDGGDSRVLFVWWQASSPATTYTNDFGVVPLGNVHAKIGGLTPSTAYGWQMHAANANGTFDSATGSFTTIAPVTAFVSAKGGVWGDADTWVQPDIPRAGADVTIASGHIVTVDTLLEEFSNVTIAGTLSFDGWDTPLQAQTVAVTGTLTHEINSATEPDANGDWIPNARVKIICDALTVNGMIDVRGKGFQGTVRGDGCGPGHGFLQKDRGSGGGYGAQGSTALQAYNVYGGLPYGSETFPDMPGSGGGATLGNANSTGGAGGGLVQIFAAGSVEITGTVNADGFNGANHCPGAGSGGGIYIQCATLSGSGTVTANGGTSTIGGGGGRIAIDITDTEAQALLSPSIQFSTASFLGVYGDRRYSHGTIHFANHTFFPYEELSYGSYVLTIGGAGSFAVDTLAVIAGEPAFAADINIAGDLVVRNSGTLLVVSNANITCGGDLLLENSGALRMHGTVTNDTASGSGNFIRVAGALDIGSNATLHLHSHPEFGYSVFLDVGSLTVSETGKIDASARGFGSGTGQVDGFGPGGGKAFAGNNDRGGGGGYGGKGATNCRGGLAKGGVAYGVANLPLLPGSGGGGKSNNTGGAGGGLVWIKTAGTVMVEGSISANGATGPATTGDGSGGGIFIDCRTFAGSGTVSADGGMSQSTTDGAGGGGGRIAIWHKVHDNARARFMGGDFSSAITNRVPETFTGNATAACGTVGFAGETAERGTVVFLTAAPEGTLLLLR